MAVMVAVTGAASNNVNLVDIGTDADTDGFVDGITAAVNSAGFKASSHAMVCWVCLAAQQQPLQKQPMRLKLFCPVTPGADTTVLVLKFMGIF